MRPGGWAFQYDNPHYPDLDDTAVVVMAMDRARGCDGDRLSTPRSRARANGSSACKAGTAAGARSTPTTTYYYLNNIPFADHGALLDPPTEDVTARCLSMLAQLGETRRRRAARCARALDYLRRDAVAGRQLVRPLGHELHLRHLVGAVRAQRRRASITTAPEVRKAVEWLVAIQNADGGWGEDGASYKLDYQRLRAGAEHRLADRLGACSA